MCVESRSVEQVHHHNILVFSRSEDQVSNCVIEQRGIRSSAGTLPCHTRGVRPVTQFTWQILRENMAQALRTTQWTECAVAMKGLQRAAYDSVADLLFRKQARFYRTQQEQKRGPTQGRSNQCASQVAVTWRSYDERKVDPDKIVRGA